MIRTILAAPFVIIGSLAEFVAAIQVPAGFLLWIGGQDFLDTLVHVVINCVAWGIVGFVFLAIGGLIVGAFARSA